MLSGFGICAARVVVDAHQHMLGRLALTVAKELLNGQRVVVVQCEEICLFDGLVRQRRWRERDIFHLQEQKLQAYKGDYDTFERTQEVHLKNQ